VKWALVPRAIFLRPQLPATTKRIFLFIMRPWGARKVWVFWGRFLLQISFTMQVTQNLLIAQVVNFLNEQGYMAWRQENNGRIDEAKVVEHLLKLLDALTQVNYTREKKVQLITDVLRKYYRKVPSSRKGVTDVIGVDLSTGKWICVEIKVGYDKLRPEQEEFMEIMRNAGGSVWLCREIESFRAGFLRKHRAQLENA